MKFTIAPDANQLVHTEYRKGWDLQPNISVGMTRNPSRMNQEAQIRGNWKPVARWLLDGGYTSIALVLLIVRLNFGPVFSAGPQPANTAGRHAAKNGKEIEIKSHD